MPPLLDQHLYGRWYSALNKIFFISREPGMTSCMQHTNQQLFETNFPHQKMSWVDARQYCCQIGMDLVSINSDDKVKYFTELAKSMF